MEVTLGQFLFVAALTLSAGVMVYISLVKLMSQARTGLAAGYGSPAGGLFAVGAFAFGIFATFLIDRLIPEVENPHHVRSGSEVCHAEHAGTLIGFLFLLPLLTPTLLSVLSAIVAGAMICISFDELPPMAETYGKHHIALAGVLGGMLFIGAGLEETFAAGGTCTTATEEELLKKFEC